MKGLFVLLASVSFGKAVGISPFFPLFYKME